MRISDWSSDVCSSDLWRWREPLTCWRRESRLPRKTISPYVIRTKGDELNLGKCRRDHHDEIRIRLAHRHKRSEEHTSELQSLIRISYAAFCLQRNNRSRVIRRTHPQLSAIRTIHPAAH